MSHTTSVGHPVIVDERDHEIGSLRKLVRDQAAEIARLTAELAAVRGNDHGLRSARRLFVCEIAAAAGIPEPQIEHRIETSATPENCQAWDDAAWSVRCAVSKLRDELAAARAVPPDAEASQPATVGIATAIRSVERIKSTSKALGYSVDYMAAIDRVLSCLRAVAENDGPLTSVVDGGTSQPATVGGLLATAPVGAIVEWSEPLGDGEPWWFRCTIGDDHARTWCEYPSLLKSRWSRTEYKISTESLRLPARLVPAHLADADPATRGPLPKGG